MLAATHIPATSPNSAPPLIIAHGLYGSGRNWGVIARRLAARPVDGRDVVTVDMRNHGASPWLASHSYADMAGDLAEVVVRFGGKADLLGHSMGGKAAMMLALTQGALLRKLIVADIAPVAYSHDQIQHITAMRALDLGKITNRSDADQRLSESVADPGLRAFFLQSLDFKSQPPVWRLNLDVLAAEMSQITGWPEPQGVFDGPALFVTGQNSPYVRPEHRPIIKAHFPNASFAKLLGAGHWLHAERPREFEETVQVFLNQ